MKFLFVKPDVCRQLLSDLRGRKRNVVVGLLRGMMEVVENVIVG
jgi:hypothetical protein